LKNKRLLKWLITSIEDMFTSAKNLTAVTRMRVLVTLQKPENLHNGITDS
jgi:hypothetical protein